MAEEDGAHCTVVSITNLPIGDFSQQYQGIMQATGRFGNRESLPKLVPKDKGRTDSGYGKLGNPVQEKSECVMILPPYQNTPPHTLMLSSQY